MTSALRILLFSIGMAMALTACTGTAAPTTTTPVTPPTTAPSTSPPSTAPPASATSVSTVCGVDSTEFSDDGVIGTLTSSGGDADQIAAIRVNGQAGCERLVIDLAAGTGAPATRAGSAQAQHLREVGIVRVELDGAITTTAVADSVFELELIDRVYVVRSLEGTIFVDVHLNAPARARLSGQTSPAQIVLDLGQGTGDIGSAHLSNLTVVTSPLGPSASYPIAIIGYARTFEATVNAVLTPDSGEAVETFGTAADFLETWGEFRLELPTGPTGPAELFVGEFSARDGERLGVFIDVDVN